MDDEAPPGAAGTRASLSVTLHSIVWQAGGSAATLAAAVWVSWRFGLAAQGDYGLARAWFDAAAVLASFGLPQGLLHLMYRLDIPAARLRPLVLRALLALAVVAAAAAALLWHAGLELAAVVALTAPWGAGHLCARSFLLAQRGVVSYGAVTALPALLVLAAMLAAGWLPSPPYFVAWLSGAVVLSSTISLVLAWRVPPGPPPGTMAGPLPAAKAATRDQADTAPVGRSAFERPSRALIQVSLQSGAQSALGALLGAALLAVIAALGHHGEDLGAASLGLHLYQVFVVMAGYVSPLLFDRWARRRDAAALALPPRLRSARRRAVAGTAALTASLLGAAALEPGHARWLLPLAVMLPAGVAAMAARVASTALLARGARGDYAELTLQAAARLLVALGVLWAALPLVGAATALGLALLVTELATWWRATAVLRRVPTR